MLYLTNCTLAYFRCVKCQRANVIHPGNTGVRCIGCGAWYRVEKADEAKSMKRMPELILTVAIVMLAILCGREAMGAVYDPSNPLGIRSGDVISGWNVKSPTNPGGYTESPYNADGVTLSPQGLSKITALVRAGGVIRYSGASQVQGKTNLTADTSPLNRSPNNLDPSGITWEGVPDMSRVTNTSPWICIPQGAYGNLGTPQSYAYQQGFSMGQRMPANIPDVFMEYSNELMFGGDQANGTANLLRARVDPRLTASDDTHRMAQEAGITWGQMLQDFTKGFKDGGGKAQVHGVFGGFIANYDWAATGLAFAKANVPGLDLAHSRLAVAGYIPGAPSDIGGIQGGETPASFLAKSKTFGQTYYPAWAAANKNVATQFGMEGLAWYEAMGGVTYDFTTGTNFMADMNRSAPEMRAFETWVMEFLSDLSDGKLDGKNLDPGALLEIEGSAGIPYNNVNSFAPSESYLSGTSPKLQGFLDFINAHANNEQFVNTPEPSLWLVSLIALLSMAGRRERRAA